MIALKSSQNAISQRKALAVLAVFGTLSFSRSVQAEDPRSKNAALLSATSPFEDLVEYALAKNDSGVSRAMARADRRASIARVNLPKQAAKDFDQRIDAIHASAAKNDYRAVADNAVEAFRILIENLDETVLETPKAVSLLDYAGFRLHVLGSSPKPDWNAIQSTASEAAKSWDLLKPSISAVGLRDAMNSTIRGVKQASSTQNLPMLEFAAQIDLDVVDLLEVFFESSQ